MSNVWYDTPGMLDRLKELHAQGCTLSQMAGILNAEYGMSFSRSAISGKVHRLGVRGQAEEVAGAQVDEVKQRRKKMERDQAKEQAKSARITAPEIVTPEPRPEPIVRVAMPPLEGGLGLDFMKINNSTCKWPFGIAPPFTFCGYPAENEKVYCPDHCEVAYNAGRLKR